MIHLAAATYITYITYITYQMKKTTLNTVLLYINTYCTETVNALIRLWLLPICHLVLHYTSFSFKNGKLSVFI